MGNLFEPDRMLPFSLRTGAYDHLLSLCLENIPPPLCAALLCCVPSLQRLALINDIVESDFPVDTGTQPTTSFCLQAYTYLGRDLAFARLPILSSLDSMLYLRTSTSILHILHALETLPHRVRALVLEPSTSGEAEVALRRRFIRACRHVRELCLRYSTVRDFLNIVQSHTAPLCVLALDRHGGASHEIAQVLAHANAARLQVLALPATIILALRAGNTTGGAGSAS